MTVLLQQQSENWTPKSGFIQKLDFLQDWNEQNGKWQQGFRFHFWTFLCHFRHVTQNDQKRLKSGAVFKR